MTNEEAIKEIQRWINGCPYEETKEAFNLAIKALEYDAKVKKYGSELAMAYAEKKHDEEYLNELEEREKGGAE